MIEINTSDRNEQRKFGLVMAGAFGILGAIRWAWHGFAVVPSYLWGIGVVFLLLGLVAPRVLQPVFVLWIKFALVLNWIMTRVFLAVAFYLIATPTSLCIRLFGEDPLKRKWLPEDQSYWEEPEEQPTDFERYKNQF